MRSCLRRPLAPGSSRFRAILVNSVMFFSFSSEIVIGFDSPTEDFAEGRAGGTFEGMRRSAARLCSAPLSFGNLLGFEDDRAPVRVGDAVQNFVRRVLN